MVMYHKGCQKTVSSKPRGFMCLFTRVRTIMCEVDHILAEVSYTLMACVMGRQRPYIIETMHS